MQEAGAPASCPNQTTLPVLPSSSFFQSLGERLPRGVATPHRCRTDPVLSQTSP